MKDVFERETDRRMPCRKIKRPGFKRTPFHFYLRKIRLLCFSEVIQRKDNNLQWCISRYREGNGLALGLGEEIKN